MSCNLIRNSLVSFDKNLQVIQILGDKFPYKLVSKKIDCKYEKRDTSRYFHVIIAHPTISFSSA